MSIAKYLRWKDSKNNEFRPVSLKGQDLLNDRILNKGTAFTREERVAFDLVGLIPPRVQSFEDQLKRVYQGYTNAPTDIQKYIFLRSLQDRNEIQSNKLNGTLCSANFPCAQFRGHARDNP